MPETLSELAQFDELVAELMAEWRIPGLALAAVRRNEAPLLRSWGVRDIDTGARVTSDTVFPICSVTKSFTATALALLVDEGRLDWDMQVREVLPEFRLRDPVATEQASLRDLLTHRTGLPRHDRVHTGGHLDNAGMLAALRHLEPSKPFRSTWQYNNLMYLVAGLVLERVSGERWEDFVRTRILRPLGMERATTSLEDMLARHPDCAMPHAVLDGEQRRIPVRPEVGDRHYGFGFNVVYYRGARRIDHGGGWSGYNCDLRLLPDHGSGVMVLTNGHDPGCAALTNTALDHLLGLEPLPWLDRLRGIRHLFRDAPPKHRAAREAARHRDTRPSHALADYAHEYAHPAYGKVRIARDGDTLRWQGIGLDRPMGHRHYDVFEIAAEPTVWFENRTVQFATSVEGDIESLAVPLEPQVAPIVFRRLPPPEMATREFLEPLTGVYRLGNIVFRIALDRAGQLTFTRNQAPTERLLPRHGHIFGFPDSDFFRIEFRRNAAGAVDALLSHEPTGTYVLERDNPLQPVGLASGD